MALLFAVVLLGTPSLMQAQTAVIQGTVTDQTGAVVPQAKVTVTNSGTNIARNAESNDTGFYRVGNLVPAIYVILIEKSGFQAVRYSAITLTVGQILTLDAKLNVTTVVSTVEVSGTAVAPIELSNATLSNVVDQRRIVDLPLLTRDPYELILLSPGVTPTNANGGFAVNGSNDRRNNFLLDGTDNNDTAVPGIPSGATALNPDSTQEFRVITNGFLPEYGRNTGAIIEVVTKSGTNRINGTAYWFGRYARLGARDFFDRTPDPDGNFNPKDPYTRNQFGVSVGGPIIKDRTFFFGNYEGQRFVTARTAGTVVPEPEVRTGIFDFNGTTVNLNSAQNLTPGIFGSLLGLDPTIQNILGRYPNPNATGNTFLGLLNFASTSQLKGDSFTIKIDHNFNSNHIFTARYTFNQTQDPNAFPTLASLPGIDGASFDGRTQSLSLGLTSIISPTIVNDLRVGANRIKAPFGCPGVDEINSVTPTLDQFGRGRDYFFAPIASWGCGILAADGQDRFTGTYSYRDTVSWTKGNHSVKFGGELRFVYENGASNFFSREALTFDLFNTFGIPVIDLNPATPCNPFTFNPAAPGGCDFGSASLQQMAGILMGITDTQSVSQFFNSQGTRTSTDNRGFRQREFAFFFQDSWKIRPTFTFTYGLRYEWYGVPFEVNNNFSNLFADPSGFAPFTFDLIGPGTGRQLYDNDNNNFAPRIGFAWDPFGNGKTVIRSSYGIFHDRIFGNLFGNTRGNPPFTVAPFFFTGDIVPNLPFIGTTTPSATVNDGEFQLPVLFERKTPMPYNQNWSLGIQHELWNTMLVELNYVGSKGTRLLRVYNGNQARPELIQAEIDAGTPESALQFTNLLFCCTNNNAFNVPFVNGTFANSSYNSLQVNVTKRFARGFQIQGAYTWSHAFDWASDPLTPTGGNAQLPRDSLDIRRSEYGQSDFDVRHRFVMNWVWELPFGRGRSYLREGFVGTFLEGWQISGIATFQNGTPYDIFCSRDSAHTGRVQRCDFANPQPILPTPDRTQTGPFAAQFSEPAFGIGNIGTVRRNSFNIPGINNFDFLLSKNTRLTENIKIEFRTEIYNAFNRARLGTPANSINSAVFGQSTTQFGRPDGTAGSRQIQFALKLHFNQ